MKQFGSRHLKVSAAELFHQFYAFELESNLKFYSLLKEETLTEQQFAQILGRVKLYNAMSKSARNGIPEIGLSDNQLNTVAVDYYSDKSHARNPDGSISLWNVYNLFTGASKSSYIDKFLYRNVLSHEGVNHLLGALNDGDSWYLN